MKAFYEIDDDALDEMDLTVRVTATVWEWEQACKGLEKLAQDVPASDLGSEGRRMLTLLGATYREVRKRAIGGFDIDMAHPGRNADAEIQHRQYKERDASPTQAAE